MRTAGRQLAGVGPGPRWSWGQESLVPGRGAGQGAGLTSYRAVRKVGRLRAAGGGSPAGEAGSS